MTPQELFDKTVTHLVLQSGPSYMVDGNKHVWCRYREPKTGRRCAVGVHITDEFYPMVKEGEGVSCHVTLLTQLGLGEHIKLLNRLQRAHDDAAFKMHRAEGNFYSLLWAALRGIATEHCLTLHKIDHYRHAVPMVIEQPTQQETNDLVTVG